MDVYISQRHLTLKNIDIIPHNNLTQEYPIFSLSERDKNLTLSQHIQKHIQIPDEVFANEFENGIYKQDRNILLQVAKNIGCSSERPFELLDKQRDGFHLVVRTVNKIAEKKKRKQVVIVTGPPGSGKSALAANLWVECATKYSKKGNIVFVTTSSSQKSNWKKVFEEESGLPDGSSMIIPSNQFNPGLTGSRVKRLREMGFQMDPQNWKECLDNYFKNGGENRVPDNNHFVAIVDEAHALINPEGHKISFASGWTLQAGPQAYHIVRASTISIFFLDEKQSYRDNETTTVKNIKDFASRLDADIQEIDLSGIQFRCGGSKKYVDWVEAILFSTEKQESLEFASDKSLMDSKFHFELVKSPFDLDNNTIRIT